VTARGRFITLEGSEGVGKSTNSKLVEQLLRERGIDVVCTREPGGTSLAEDLRGVLLARRDEVVSPLAELLIVFAARAQHLDRVIRPALAAGRWVVCDRFTDATYAYQGGGRGIAEGDIARLEQWVHADVQPDLTLYLDLPVDVGLARVAQAQRDRFESEARAFFERIRAVYLARAAELPRFATIDARGSLGDVERRVRAAVTDFLDRVG